MLLHCPTCATRTSMRSHGSFRRTQSESEAVDKKVTLHECEECSSPIVTEAPLVYDDEFGGATWGEAERVLPANANLEFDVPGGVASALDEARRCAQFGCFTACAVMCRRTIEMMCREKNVNTGNLASNLKKLAEDSVIDARLHQWATALRSDGNLAAHDPQAMFSANDARDLLDFTRAIIDYVYVLDAKFREFEMRRQTKRTASDAVAAALSPVVRDE